MKIHVGEEKIVVMSPAFPKGCWGEAAVDWGPYEFPKAGRHPDGRLFVRWHMGNDCVEHFVFVSDVDFFVETIGVVECAEFQ